MVVRIFAHKKQEAMVYNHLEAQKAKAVYDCNDMIWGENMDYSPSYYTIIGRNIHRICDLKQVDILPEWAIERFTQQ